MLLHTNIPIMPLLPNLLLLLLPPLLALHVIAAVGPVSQPRHSPPLDAFLPPLLSLQAINAELSPAANVSSPDACAAMCIASGDRCVSFNLCKPDQTATPNVEESKAESAFDSTAAYSCTLNTFTRSYRPSASSHCSLYTKLRPRNDSRTVQAVPWAACAPPPRSVSLRGQLLGSTFDLHRDIYLAVRSPMDMLYWFFVRAQQQPPPEARCFGWGGWIKGTAPLLRPSSPDCIPLTLTIRKRNWKLPYGRRFLFAMGGRL